MASSPESSTAVSTGTTMDIYNEAQILGLAFSRILGSSLSLVGAGCLIYMTSRQREIKERLLLGMSLANWMLAAGIFLAPFLAPSYTDTPLASGNNATCAFSGFLFLSALTIGCTYSAYLSLYFWLVVQRKWRDSDFTKEWLAHALAFGIPVLMTALGVAAGTIHPQPHAANICMYGCNKFLDDSPEVTMCKLKDAKAAALLVFITALIVLVCTIVATVCVIKVSWYVRNTIHRSSVYTFESQMFTTADIATNSTDESNARRRNSARRKTTLQRKNEERVQQMWTQALCYTLAYINCLAWVIVVVIVNIKSKEIRRVPHGEFIVRILSSFFSPLQGFLNFLVYTRGDYNQWRGHQPQKSCFWIFQQILTNQTIPRRLSQEFSGDSKLTSSDLQPITSPNISITQEEKRPHSVVQFVDEVNPRSEEIQDIPDIDPFGSPDDGGGDGRDSVEEAMHNKEPVEQG